MPVHQYALFTFLTLLETRLPGVYFATDTNGGSLFIFAQWTKKPQHVSERHASMKTKFNVKRPLKVIQCHLFWGQCKAMTVTYYHTLVLLALFLMVARYSHQKTWKLPLSNTTLLSEAPLWCIHVNFHTNLISTETKDHGLHFAAFDICYAQLFQKALKQNLTQKPFKVVPRLSISGQ